MQLKEIGALLPTTTIEVNGNKESVYKNDDGDLTVLGKLVSSMPIDVRLGKLVIFGHLFNCLEENIIIAAGLSNKSIFSFPSQQKSAGYNHKFIWSKRSFSDCIAVYNAYKVWEDKTRTGYFREKNEKQWCRANFLQDKSLREMSLTIKEIQRSLERFEIKVFHLPNRRDRNCRNVSDNNYLILKICIFGAFFPVS